MRYIRHEEINKGEKKLKKMVLRITVSVLLCFSLCFSAAAAEMLVPVGKVVGLSLAEGSVTVVDFDQELGTCAREAGLQLGDDITKVDGAVIDSTADLHQALNKSDGSVKLTVTRNGREHQLCVNPAATADGPKLGVYVREGVSGIGTITYYDPDTGSFGALGHGVSNGQGQTVSMRSGTIYQASVAAVKRGQIGQPGQLKGTVDVTAPIGSLRRNCGHGVFGSCERFSGEPIPVGQAEKGSAQILSNIHGDAVETFAVEITKVFENEESGRDMMLRVTDPALLETTGGIVAGMRVSYNRDNTET